MQNFASKVNGARHLDSRRLAYELRGKGPGQRAALAANLIERKFQLSRPTDKQRPDVVGVGDTLFRNLPSQTWRYLEP
jgi:hypothetical protein